MRKFLHFPRELLLVLALFMLLPLAQMAAFPGQVVVIADGQAIELRTDAQSPEDIIDAAGITLNEGDSWRFRNMRYGSVIEVLRARAFTLVVGETETEYRSSAETVGEALRALGIRFGRGRVYPHSRARLEEGMRVYVIGSDERLRFGEADVAFPTEYLEEQSMEYGTERVEAEGQNGRARVISRVSRKNSGETRELGREVIQQPTSRVVRKGMANSVKTPEGYKRYTKKMTVEASAYTINEGSGTGLTSIGLVPREGIVAVDPRVIPYYTKMYVPGYGLAMAGDTGGAIVGNRVDLFMDDWNEAIRWGRRNIEIYILED